MLDGIEEDPDFPGFEEIPDPGNECGKFFCLFGVAVRNFQKIGQFFPDRMPRCLFDPENFRDPDGCLKRVFPYLSHHLLPEGWTEYPAVPGHVKNKEPRERMGSLTCLAGRKNVQAGKSRAFSERWSLCLGSVDINPSFHLPENVCRRGSVRGCWKTVHDRIG